MCLLVSFRCFFDFLSLPLLLFCGCPQPHSVFTFVPCIFSFSCVICSCFSSFPSLCLRIFFRCFLDFLSLSLLLFWGCPQPRSVFTFVPCIFSFSCGRLLLLSSFPFLCLQLSSYAFEVSFPFPECFFLLASATQCLQVLLVVGHVRCFLLLFSCFPSLCLP